MRAGKKRQVVDNKLRKTRACIVIVKDIVNQEDQTLSSGKILRSSKQNIEKSGTVVKSELKTATTKSAGIVAGNKKPEQKTLVNQVDEKIKEEDKITTTATTRVTQINKRLASQTALTTRRSSSTARTLKSPVVKSKSPSNVTAAASVTKPNKVNTTPAVTAVVTRRTSVLRSVNNAATTPTNKSTSKSTVSSVTKFKSLKTPNPPTIAGSPIAAVTVNNSNKVTKMYKQAKVMSIATTPPPTIAASRSRRSIKPNPKYASEDIVTPKYVSALTTDSHSSVKKLDSKMQRTSQDSADDEFFNKSLDDDFIEDDDELADEAFKPQSQGSDEDDLSDMDMFANEYAREKQPKYIRRRGRPPKLLSQNVRTTPSTVSHQRSGPGKSGGAPSQLQQLRRTMSDKMRANSAALTSGAMKRKALDLDENDGEQTMARKRFITSAGAQSAGSSSTISKPTSNDGKKYIMRKSMPMLNGVSKNATTSSGSDNTRASNAAQGNSITRARSILSNSASKAISGTSNKYEVSKMRPRVLPAISRSGANKSSSTVGSGGSAKLEERRNATTRRTAETNTFTIVNIDDIINQDDVLISKMPTKSSLSSAKSTGSSSSHNNSHASTANASTTSSGVKRTPFANKSLSGKSAAQQQSQNNNKLNSVSSSNQGLAQKPAPRILNSEVGKKTQPMKPLMNMVDDMAKELCAVVNDDYYPTDDDDEDDVLDDEIEPAPRAPARRNVYRGANNNNKSNSNVTKLTSAANNRNNNNNNNNNNNKIIKEQQINKKLGSLNVAKRKLATLLCDDEESVFKKPSPTAAQKTYETHKENLLAATNQKANHQSYVSQPQTKFVPKTSTTIDSATSSVSAVSLPGETTTISCEGGRIVKKVTCYETWHVISVPKDTPVLVRSKLNIPLIKLANAAIRIKLPTDRWSSKVTLFKLAPTVITKQPMILYTGDLKVHNIPEGDRSKYQPSCVLFRRAVQNNTRLPYDRAIIFKNRSFYTNIDGKHVNLVGAPEIISTVKDIEILLEIVDGLSLKSSLVETISVK